MCILFSFSLKMFPILSTSISATKYLLQDLHYHFQGPALSLPGTCIITSEDVHFHLRDLHYCFRTWIFSSGTFIITSRACIIASGPALFSRNSLVQKIKTNRCKIYLIGHFLRREIFISEWALSLRKQMVPISNVKKQ